MSKYFYKLGFNPEFGISEFQSLTDANYQTDENKSWLFSDEFLEVNKTGSLVFAGEVVLSFKKEDLSPNFAEIFEGFSRFLAQKNSENGEFKKVGLAILGQIFSKNADKKFLDLLKSSGCKKVNMLPTGKTPTIGNFKNTKKWLILFETKTDLIIGYVKSYANQEFWNNLDFKLPKSDMKRGLMNLKLARSLLNFTDSKKVWDPFCGQGRTVLSGLDLKEEFYLSDIDFKCLKEADENLSFAQNYFQRNQLLHSPSIEVITPDSPLAPSKVELATFNPAFELDAQNLDIAEGIDFKNIAIVTEGFLGYNFTNTADTSKMRNEWEKLEILWKTILTKASRLEIPEIIFCLPFYQTGGKRYLPEFYKNLVQNTNYKFQKLATNNDFLLYSREKSFVGHFVLKVELN